MARNREQKRRERRAYCLDYLGGKCVWPDCTITKRLQFDHIDRTTKLFEISQRLQAPIDLLNAELDKCQLLCPSHHIEKSHIERGHVGEAKHGTVSRYTNKHQCRCDECRAGWRAYVASRRAML